MTTQPDIPSQEATRRVLLDDLRVRIKNAVTYAEIARHTGNTPNWIGEVLRGNYPGYGMCLLPKSVWQVLEGIGFTVADELKTFAQEARRTDRQAAYLIRLCEEKGIDAPAEMDTLTTRQASAMIQNLHDFGTLRAPDFL